MTLRPVALAITGLVAAGAASAQETPPIEVTGFVDTYWGYSFNKVDPVQLRNFDVDHNSFTISLAEIASRRRSRPVAA
jgi:hypothetical protein